MSEENEIDLGLDHRGRFVGWHPDRTIPSNAELFRDVQDIDRIGLIINHPDGKGGRCEALIDFDSQEARKILSPRSLWTVESWDPLTVSPSVLCLRCNAHGFIRGGRWVPA